MSRRGNQLKRFQYYLLNTLSILIPTVIYRTLLDKSLKGIASFDPSYIKNRVNYYNKLSGSTTLPTQLPLQISTFKKTGGTTYFFDLRKVIKYFPQSFRFAAELGDITEVPLLPSFLKSRPISQHNQNSVLLKLNAIRHYNFVDDSLSYSDKKDQVVWRGSGFRQNRLDMLTKYYDHPQCDVGRTDFKSPDLKGPTSSVQEAMKLFKTRQSVDEQLSYKFILSIEGKDVATNLKWIMSSSSLCLMTKPKFETWFMEGRLQASVHYVDLKEDYSDLIDKMNYYLVHEEEALSIIKNANEFVDQFKNPQREAKISLLVAQKYFQQTGQL